MRSPARARRRASRPPDRASRLRWSWSRSGGAMRRARPTPVRETSTTLEALSEAPAGRCRTSPVASELLARVRPCQEQEVRAELLKSRRVPRHVSIRFPFIGHRRLPSRTGDATRTRSLEGHALRPQWPSVPARGSVQSERHGHSRSRPWKLLDRRGSRRTIVPLPPTDETTEAVHSPSLPIRHRAIHISLISEMMVIAEPSATRRCSPVRVAPAPADSAAVSLAGTSPPLDYFPMQKRPRPDGPCKTCMISRVF
jgi:hypothetical protein